MGVAEKVRTLINGINKAFLCALVLFCGYFINIVPAFSFFHLKFKAITLFAPVFASFFPTSYAIVTFGFLALLKTASLCILKAPVFVSFGLPLLVGSLAWRESLGKRASWLSFVVHVCIPLFAMMAFFIHPVSRPAYAYALYWLIPVAFYGAKYLGFMKKMSDIPYLYCAALASTFVTHSIGASMYLFTVLHSTDLWLSLIPVVPLERGLVALGVVALHSGFYYVKYARRHPSYVQ